MQLLVTVLRRNWFFLVVAVGVGGAVGVFLGVVKPNSYDSHGKLLVRAGLREVMSPESLIAGGQIQQGRLSEISFNEVWILRRPDLYRRVVDALGLDIIFKLPDPAVNDDEATSPLTRLFHELQSSWLQSGAADANPVSPERLEQLAVEQLQERLHVSVSGRSGILNVSCSAPSPEVARIIVATFMDLALDYHREFFEQSDSLGVLMEGLGKAEKDLVDASSAMTMFRAKHGIMDLALEKNSLIRDIFTLRSEIAAVEGERIGLKKLQDYFGEELKGEDVFFERVTEGPATINPERASLYAQKQSLELQILELEAATTGAGLTQTRLKRLGVMKSEVETRLVQTPRMLPGAKTTILVDNPRYERLRQELDAIGSELLKSSAKTGWRAGGLKAKNYRLDQLEALDSVASDARGRIALARSRV